MRRVLFGTGFPQTVPEVLDPVATPEDCLSILDLRSLSAEFQSYTYFLTLFSWPTMGIDNLGIYVQVGSETPFLVGRISPSTDVSSVLPTSIRFPIQGNVRVFAASVVDGNTSAIFGYYEIDTTPTVEIVRPLQAAAPISPFTNVPVSTPTSTTATIHAFEEDYVDTITIDHTVIQAGGLGSATFNFPNGVSLLTKTVNATQSQYNLMSGIPMLPNAAGQVITVTTDGNIVALITTGFFTR